MDHPGYGDFRARREATVWQRLNRILRVLLVLALVLVIVSLFLPQAKKLRQSRELKGISLEEAQSSVTLFPRFPTNERMAQVQKMSIARLYEVLKRTR